MLSLTQRTHMHSARHNMTSIRIWAVAGLVLCAGLTAAATTKGPDAGGYSGTDAVTYSFVDISGAGGGVGVLAGIDDGAVALTLPFAFNFYGQPYTLLCVSANGALHFTPTDSACTSLNDFANTDLSTLPTPGDYPALLPFWSDLTFQTEGAGAVLYRSTGTAGSRRFIVQWDNAYPQGFTAPVTFQVILSEGTNTILFQYKTVNLGSDNAATNGAQATVGIRNTGAPATQQQVAWSYAVPVLGDNTALLFTPSPSGSTGEARMNGAGYLLSAGQHQHFVFRVSQDQGYGRLEYWTNEAAKCSPADHGPAMDRGTAGNADNDYASEHGKPVNRFQSTSITQVAFASSNSSVKFTGTGTWNGQPGFTFEAQATDNGNPGRGRDQFALTIRNASGATVETAKGTLEGGNIQSNKKKESSGQ